MTWFDHRALPQDLAPPGTPPDESTFSPELAWQLSLVNEQLRSTSNSSWSAPTPWQWESNEDDLLGAYTFPLSSLGELWRSFWSSIPPVSVLKLTDSTLAGTTSRNQQPTPSKNYNSLGLSMESSPPRPTSFAPSNGLGLFFGTVERSRQSSCSSTSSCASTSSVLSYLPPPTNSPALVPISLPSPELVPFDLTTSEPFEELDLSTKDTTPPTPSPQPLALPDLPSLRSRPGVLRGEAYDPTPHPSSSTSLVQSTQDTPIAPTKSTPCLASALVDLHPVTHHPYFRASSKGEFQLWGTIVDLQGRELTCCIYCRFVARPFRRKPPEPAVLVHPTCVRPFSLSSSQSRPNPPSKHTAPKTELV